MTDESANTEGNQYFKSDFKKIFPIKKYLIMCQVSKYGSYITHLNKESLKPHMVKKPRGRVWRFQVCK